MIEDIDLFETGSEMYYVMMKSALACFEYELWVVICENDATKSLKWV